MGEETGETYAGEAPINVLPYVLVALLVKVLIGIGLAFAPEIGISGSTLSTITTLASVGLALVWYSRRVNRPMAVAERARFAAGVTLADLVLSIAWIFAMLIMIDAPFDAEGLNAAFGGGEATAGGTIVWVLVAAGGFSLILTFVLAFVLAWTMTRKLPAA